MTVHHIPPRDPNEDRLKRIRASLTEVLRPYITGKKKDDKLEEAVTKAIGAIRSQLKLKNPRHGATVMTEAASNKDQSGNFRKGPNNL
jgi:hypothetical protein